MNETLKYERYWQAEKRKLTKAKDIVWYVGIRGHDRFKDRILSAYYETKTEAEKVIATNKRKYRFGNHRWHYIKEKDAMSITQKSESWINKIKYDKNHNPTPGWVTIIMMPMKRENAISTVHMWKKFGTVP